MHSHRHHHRPLSAVALIGAVLAPGSCQPPAPAAPGGKPEPVVRLVESLAEAHTLPPAAPSQEIVLFDSWGDDQWQPLVRLQREPTEDERRAFEEASRVQPYGTVEIGPCHGFWLRTVEVEGGTTVLLRGRLSVETVSGGPEDAFAQVGLAELAGETEGVPARELAERVELFHTTPLFGAPSNGEQSFALLVELADETTTVGITLAQSLEQDPPAGGVRFSDVALVRPDVWGYAAAATGQPQQADLARTLDRLGLVNQWPLQELEPAPDWDTAWRSGDARGGYSIGRVRREGLFVPLGGSLRWRLALPEGTQRFETWAGLVPHDDFESDLEVQFRAVWRFPGREDQAPAAVHEAVVQATTLPRSRWVRIAGDVPAELVGRGRLATLDLTAHAPEASSLPPGRPRALPVFGDPRIVPAKPVRSGPNVVLISLDTLRADHVGAYGYERPTTPHLDALAAESLVFEDVWAQGPYTLPSHMSMLSGQHPSVHGVHRDDGIRDPARTPLLAELLSSAGWTTAAFTGGGYVHPVFGFDAGFHTFSSLELVWNRESSRIREVLRDLPDVDVALAEERSLAEVTDWIAEHSDESFFLFFHTYAAHEFDPPAHHLRALGADERGLSDDTTALQHLRLLPGDPERPIPPADVQRLMDLYDGGVRQADEAVGALVAALRDEGLWDETIFVVTSDHGQEIGEHGEVGHGHTLYEEMLKVPLIVRLPGVPAQRIDSPAMLVDIMPTLLNALDLDENVASKLEMQGHDLRDLPTQRDLFSEVENAAYKRALRRGSLKTIHGPPIDDVPFPNTRLEESYDLARDPLELEPLPLDPKRLEPLLAHVEVLQALAAALSSGHVSGSRVDAALRAQLSALGYGGEGGPEEDSGD